MSAMYDSMIFAPDGTCKIFDGSASGFDREGSQHRLHHETDNDPVRVIICG